MSPQGQSSTILQTILILHFQVKMLGTTESIISGVFEAFSPMIKR